MSLYSVVWRTYHAIVALSILCWAKESPKPLVLDDDNWSDMVQGEWMVKFYAPWCPACSAIAHTWDQLASYGEGVDINVGKVDVTQNPGLSGRFMVVSLPTIFHVKNGVFREYSGSRQENDLKTFLDLKRWEDLDPIPWYKSPSSLHMSALAQVFKFAKTLMVLHTWLTEDYGLPVWGSYVFCAVCTGVIGLVVGTLSVYLYVAICASTFHSSHKKSQKYSEIDKNLDGDLTEPESDVIEDDTISTEAHAGSDVQ